MWRSMLCCSAPCSWDLISTHTAQSAPRRCLLPFEFLHIFSPGTTAREHGLCTAWDSRVSDGTHTHAGICTSYPLHTFSSNELLTRLQCVCCQTHVRKRKTLNQSSLKPCRLGSRTCGSLRYTLRSLGSNHRRRFGSHSPGRDTHTCSTHLQLTSTAVSGASSTKRFSTATLRQTTASRTAPLTYQIQNCGRCSTVLRWLRFLVGSPWH
jgi:hypothetical protein